MNSLNKMLVTKVLIPGVIVGTLASVAHHYLTKSDTSYTVFYDESGKQQIVDSKDYNENPRE